MNRNVAVPFLGSISMARALPYVGSGLVHCAVFASVGLAAAPPHLPPTAADRAVALELVEEAPSPPDPDQHAVPTSNRAASGAPEHGHQHRYPVPATHDATPHDPKLEHLPAASEALSARSDAPTVAAPVAQEAHFVMRMPPPGAAVTAGVQSGPGGGSGEVSAIVPEAAVSARATLISSAPASYPPEARSSEAEADVSLEIVVDTTGAVREARALSRAGLGFEAAALAAIRAYRFSPALKDGHPVRVRMRWSVQFRLH
jgi:TonB family protein